MLKEFLKRDYRILAAMISDVRELRSIIELRKAPHFTTCEKAAERLLDARRAKRALGSSVRRAVASHVVRPTVSLAAMDGTGMESHHASVYYVRRKAIGGKPGRKRREGRYPKMGVVCDCDSHWVVALVPGQGPGPDILHFRAALNQALDNVQIETLAADAGYDSEATHQFTRQQTGVRTLIPATIGRRTDKPLRGYLRRHMKSGLHLTRYGQRWQVDTGRGKGVRYQCHCRAIRNRCAQRQEARRAGARLLSEDGAAVDCAVGARPSGHYPLARRDLFLVLGKAYSGPGKVDASLPQIIRSANAAFSSLSFSHPVRRLSVAVARVGSADRRTLEGSGHRVRRGCRCRLHSGHHLVGAVVTSLLQGRAAQLSGRRGPNRRLVVDARAYRLQQQYGGHCRARRQITDEVLRKISGDIARHALDSSSGKNTASQCGSSFLDAGMGPASEYESGRVVMVNGFTVTAADTEENQAEYPQNPAQKEGPGFPLLRGVALSCMRTGMLLDVEMGPYTGKGTGETALV